MYCKNCSSNMIISVTHFEQNNTPKRYDKCKKCQMKSKEVLISFKEILDEVQKSDMTMER